MINIKNLTFSYGEKKIFENFNLKINDGSRICLSGESGIGKTTLLRLIMGLEKDYEGVCEVSGKKIVAVFQEDRLLPFKTVMENITLFASKDSALEALEALGIGDAANSYPSQLSGGMARRVAIARALCAEGDIYIFDEPFNGIDAENTKRVAEYINKKTQGKTVIAVSHKDNAAQILNADVVDI